MIAFRPKTKKERFENAVSMIKMFLDDYRSEYEYKLQDYTTNNFEEFKREITRNKFMYVSNEGNENTMYMDRHYNVLARVWHDNVHLKHDLDFSFNQESIVCQYQIEEIEIYLDSIATDKALINDVKQLIYIDIIGQADYYRLNGDFVENQILFVYDNFLA